MNMNLKNWRIISKHDWLQVLPAQGYQAIYMTKVGDDKYHLWVEPVEFLALVLTEDWCYETMSDGSIKRTLSEGDKYQNIIVLDSSEGFFQEANENGICKIGTPKEEWRKHLNNSGSMTGKSEIVYEWDYDRKDHDQP